MTDIIVALFTGALGYLAFPTVQHLILKRITRRHGNPELWHLPKFGFRLVVRNIPNGQTLYGIKSRCIIRKVVFSERGSSVDTYLDDTIHEKEDFFLLPQNDLILIGFKIDKSDNQSLHFVVTDKIGRSVREIPFDCFDMLIVEYIANIKNKFNFDVKIAKQIVLKKNEFEMYWQSVSNSNHEQKIHLSSIISIK